MIKKIKPSDLEAAARRLIDAGQMPSLEQALPYSYCTYSVVILPPFDFTRNDGPTAVAAPNLPSPEQAKAGPMPSHDRFRLDDGHR